MKFKKPIPVQLIAEKYDLEIIGDANLMATGINEIHKVEEGMKNAMPDLQVPILVGMDTGKDWLEAH